MNTTLPNLETRTHDQLTEWPGNARQGDVDTIKESMRTNGVFQPVIIQTSTGRIIAGNHRYKALVELHREAPDTWGDNVTVLPLDVSDSEAERIHVADNKTSDLADWDYEALVAQLTDLEATTEGLTGTGFDDAELAALRSYLDSESMVDDFEDDGDVGDVDMREGKEFTVVVKEDHIADLYDLLGDVEWVTDVREKTA